LVRHFFHPAWRSLGMNSAMGIDESGLNAPRIDKLKIRIGALAQMLARKPLSGPEPNHR